MARTVNDDRRAWLPDLPTEPIQFASDFAWGVASSAFQAEGGAVANDWVAAAADGRVPVNPGNGFWQRAEADLRLVAGLGVRHYRLSIEWSRVEPERGRFDTAALDRYRAICDAARAVGLTPWVNLFHFTHPRWFAERGGFLDPANHDDFRRYVEHVGRALAPHARHFHTQNESMAYVFGCYLLGQMPPFVADRDAALAMTRHVLALHADGYRILKSIDPRLTVATIEVYLDFRPADPTDDAQRAAVEAIDAWYHGTVLEALRSGWVTVPGREPEEIPHLKNALDLYGFNYYSSIALTAAGYGSFAARPDAPIDTMGRRVFPAGMEAGLLRVAAALPGCPIMVTENGCPTRDEVFRIRYLAAHLAALDRARRQGADVRGYFHWTAVDNYEWLHGFSDARFGLIGFDPSSGARRVKRSGDWLRAVIAQRALQPDAIP
jgi:beta-glucosidase